MFFRISLTLILFAIIITVLTACSSTSTSERYRKPQETESEEESSSVRFTSKDNRSQDSEQTNFRDIPDSLSEFDELPVEDNPISREEFLSKYEHIESFSAALTTREKILFEIINYLDTPYLYGGINKNGIDCSAFTQNVFNHSIGLKLPRTAREQFSVGEEIDKEELIFGDLIFFNTTSRSYPGHVGIYMGEDLFAHASRSLGVTVSSLKSTYYKTRFVGARRIK